MNIVPEMMNELAKCDSLISELKSYVISCKVIGWSLGKDWSKN